MTRPAVQHQKRNLLFLPLNTLSHSRSINKIHTTCHKTYASKNKTNNQTIFPYSIQYNKNSTSRRSHLPVNLSHSPISELLLNVHSTSHKTQNNLNIAPLLVNGGLKIHTIIYKTKRHSFALFRGH